MSTQTISGRLPPAIHGLLLKQIALGQVKSQTISRHAAEGVLSRAFPGVAFRESEHGREAFVAGHRLAVWEVAQMAEEMGGPAKAASHLNWPVSLVKKALRYAEAFPDEIAAARQAETT